MKRTGLVVTFFIVLFALAGCGLPAPKNPPKKIAGIIFNDDQFFRLVTLGMRNGATARGYELLEANTNSKPDREIQLINTYISGGVEGIIISPLSLTASRTALQLAKEKGIVVVTYNTTVEGDIPVAYVESNQEELGETTGREVRRFVEERFNGKAAIGILAFQIQAPEQSNARVAGFKRALDGAPGIRVVAEQDAWLAEMAIKKASDILTAHPDINILWAANEGGTVGSAMAVKNAGKAGRVFVFGTDASQQLADFLLADDDILQAVTGQRPYAMGETAVEMMDKALRGEQVTKRLSLAGRLISRSSPDSVRAFRQELQKLAR